MLTYELAGTTEDFGVRPGRTRPSSPASSTSASHKQDRDPRTESSRAPARPPRVS